MGAWGHGSFDNDGAMDWLGDLADGETGVREALEAVTEQGEEYLEVDDASSALAAAELVAAWHDRDRSRLPETAGQWLDAHGSQLVATDVPLAARAVALVLDAERSELAQLWAESDAEEWREGVLALQRRLTR